MEKCECTQESRIKYLEQMTDKNNEEHKEIYQKLELIGKDAVRMDERFTNIMATLNQINCTLSELKGKDGKKWETFVGAIIIAAASGLIGYFFSTLG